jgi:hypothetical protein
MRPWRGHAAPVRQGAVLPRSALHVPELHVQSTPSAITDRRMCTSGALITLGFDGKDSDTHASARAHTHTHTHTAAGVGTTGSAGTRGSASSYAVLKPRNRLETANAVLYRKRGTCRRFEMRVQGWRGANDLALESRGRTPRRHALEHLSAVVASMGYQLTRQWSLDDSRSHNFALLLHPHIWTLA